MSATAAEPSSYGRQLAVRPGAAPRSKSWGSAAASAANESAAALAGSSQWGRLVALAGRSVLGASDAVLTAVTRDQLPCGPVVGGVAGGGSRCHSLASDSDGSQSRHTAASGSYSWLPAGAKASRRTAGRWLSGRQPHCQLTVDCRLTVS